MKCKKCKKTIDDKSNFCQKCGFPVEKSFLKASLAIAARTVRQFSLGAFIFGWIYFLGSGAFLPAGLILLVSVILNAAQFYGLMHNQPLALAGAVMNLSFALFIGLIGRRVSYKARQKTDSQCFRKIQMYWDIAGGIFLGLIILISVLLTAYSDQIQQTLELL